MMQYASVQDAPQLLETWSSPSWQTESVERLQPGTGRVSPQEEDFENEAGREILVSKEDERNCGGEAISCSSNEPGAGWTWGGVLLTFVPLYGLFVFGTLGLTLFSSTNCIFLLSVGPPLLVVVSSIVVTDGGISPRHATFSGLTSLCLCIPMFLLIPILRTAWIIVLRILSSSWMNWIGPTIQPWGILAWLFVDSLFLKGFMQELLKFAVCVRALRSAWHRGWTGLVVHGVVAACAIAAVEAGLEAVVLKQSLRSMEEFFTLMDSTEAVLRDPAVAHRSAMIWSYALYHGVYCYFSQAFLGAAIACKTYRFACLENQPETLASIMILQWPTLFHGAPLFLAHLIRAYSQSQAFQFLSKSATGIDLNDLAQLASTAALCEVALFFTMTSFLCSSFIFARAQINSLARDTGSNSAACLHCVGSGYPRDQATPDDENLGSNIA